MTTVDLPDEATIRRRHGEIRGRIAAAGGTDAVRLVAVTKAFPVTLVDRALAAGLADLGENYAQELLTKAAHVGPATEVTEPGSGSGSGSGELPVGPVWHFIGGLQRNKVKQLAGTVSFWHSVDRSSLIDEIAKRDPGARILIQVNTTGEPQKAGCEPGDVPAMVDRGREAQLAVLGLMTVGPTSPDVDPRPCFELLRELAASVEVAELSMGMSADFELAVAEGATMVRIGSTLFGPRPVRRN